MINPRPAYSRHGSRRTLKKSISKYLGWKTWLGMFPLTVGVGQLWAGGERRWCYIFDPYWLQSKTQSGTWPPITAQFPTARWNIFNLACFFLTCQRDYKTRLIRFFFWAGHCSYSTIDMPRISVVLVVLLWTFCTISTKSPQQYY